MPITWRSVPVDNGANAAAFGQSANNLFSGAQQGLSIFSDQMDERVKREDMLRTNAAIKAALTGGPLTSDDRRVSAIDLFNITSKNAIDKSALETARLTQTGLGIGNEHDALRLKYAPDIREENSAKNAQEILESLQSIEESKGAQAASAAARSVDLFGLERAKWQHTQDVEADQAAEKDLKDTEWMYAQKAQLRDGRISQILQRYYDEGRLQPGEKPLPSVMHAINEEAEAWVTSPEALNGVEKLAVDRGVSKSVIEAGWSGDLRSRTAAIMDAENQRRLAQQTEEDKNLTQYQREVKNGIYAGGKLDPTTGNIVPSSDDDRKDNVTNLREALAVLRSSKKVNVEGLSDDDKEVIESIVDVFPHPSLFVPIISSFHKDGEFDRKTALKRTNEGAQSILDHANIQRSAEDPSIGIARGGTDPGDAASDPSQSILNSFAKFSTGGVFTDKEVDKFIEDLRNSPPQVNPLLQAPGEAASMLISVLRRNAEQRRLEEEEAAAKANK